MHESTVEPATKPGEQALFKGNPTECALLTFAADSGSDWAGLRAGTPGRSEATGDQVAREPVQPQHGSLPV